MLRSPEPLPPREPLGIVADDGLAAALDVVIVRGGPGSWAKNVDWDEYVIRVRNPGDDPLHVDGITVVDSLGTPIPPGVNRSQLVSGTREAKRRYKGEGLKVKAGVNGAVLMGAGAAAAAGTSGVGAAAMAGGGAAVGAAAVVVMVPVLAVGGAVRAVNNSKVNGEIENRQTLLPFEVTPGDEKTVHVFFPVSPSPLRVEFVYHDSLGSHTTHLDTGSALRGLHLAPATQ